jgi:hypothetical protein
MNKTIAFLIVVVSVTIVLCLAQCSTNPAAPPIRIGAVDTALVGTWVSEYSELVLSPDSTYTITHAIMPHAEYGTWVGVNGKINLKSISDSMSYTFTYHIDIDTLLLCRDSVCETLIKK